MKPTTIYLMIAVGALAYWYKTRKTVQAQQHDMGGGWVMNADGTKATGPNGETAMKTGYMTADPYPAAGAMAI